MIFKWLKKRRREANKRITQPYQAFQDGFERYLEKREKEQEKVIKENSEALEYFSNLKDPEQLKRDVISGKLEEMAFNTCLDRISERIDSGLYTHLDPEVVYNSIKNTGVNESWALARCTYLFRYVENLKKYRKEEADKLRAIRRGELS